MVFTWDPQKADENLRKHGVDVREAATVFDDPLSTTFPDDDHSSGAPVTLWPRVERRGPLPPDVEEVVAALEHAV